MKTVELNVSGMSCGHCVDTVRSALAAVHGVADAEVSLADGRARVSAQDEAKEDAFVQAVERVGYRATLAPGH